MTKKVFYCIFLETGKNYIKILICLQSFISYILQQNYINNGDFHRVNLANVGANLAIMFNAVLKIY